MFLSITYDGKGNFVMPYLFMESRSVVMELALAAAERLGHLFYIVNPFTVIILNSTT